MKNTIKNKNLSSKPATVLANVALMSSTVAANTRCMCLFHQPKVPKEIEKLRKF